ncbi:CD206 [Mytilus edulis]|uniref:MRC n=1 Tax=Mytilus edulis TaxID=6550 RepID=A0A8S3SHR0_MYTED|nr:CD206 [Mytilus edulis]
MLYGCTLGNGEFTFIAGTISYLLEQCVYSVIDHSSLSDCTMQCLLDEYNNCSRFVFESDTQRCMLQSDYISSDVPTTTIDTAQAIMFFEAHVDCIAGYDFDRHTKLCINEFGDSTTWLDARARCKQDGGDLISIPSLEKWRFVFNYLEAFPGGHWIGLNNSVWMTGEPFKNALGIPNNLLDVNVTSDATCGRLRFRGLDQHKCYEMNPCSEKKKFVCEIQII